MYLHFIQIFGCVSLIICTENVEFFFVDTNPFVEEYFSDPGEHTYDWEGVLPRKDYISRLLKVGDKEEILCTNFHKIFKNNIFNFL